MAMKRRPADLIAVIDQIDRNNAVQINDQQSFDEMRFNDRYIRVTVHFHGQAWESFFREAFRLGLPRHTPNYMIGAEIDYDQREIAIAGGYAHAQFAGKYAGMIEGWNFKKSKRPAIVLPKGGQKFDDELRFTINGRAVSELQPLPV